MQEILLTLKERIIILVIAIIIYLITVYLTISEAIYGLTQGGHDIASLIYTYMLYLKETIMCHKK
jgi:hypothetical protein